MVAVVVTGVDATEMIPLLGDNGSGVYNKGVNNIADFREFFLGAMVGHKSNIPHAYRDGVLNASSHVAGDLVDLKAVSTGGAGTQAVAVFAGNLLKTRTGQGPSIIAQRGNVSVPMPAADGSNPRRDLLCLMPYDKGSFPADAQHGAKYIVVTGDPSGSPVTPALPAAVADAFPIAMIARGVGDNTIADADITDLRTGASLHGVPRHLLGGDSVADAGLCHGEIRVISGAKLNALSPALVAAGTSMVYEYWDFVTATWKRINGRALVDNYYPSGTVALTTTEQMVDGRTFSAIQGHTYEFVHAGGFQANTTGYLNVIPRIAAGGSVSTASPKVRTNWDRLHIAGAQGAYHTSVTWTAPTTGTYTMGAGFALIFGPVSGSLLGADTFGRSTLIKDLEY